MGWLAGPLAHGWAIGLGRRLSSAPQIRFAASDARCPAQVRAAN